MMILPAWTVWWIRNVDRMKLSWRPWEKVEGLKEQTQKRINHHLISKGHAQMFQSEGALCFTTPKAEHYVSGWKQVPKMSGGWHDIQVWRKWNRKLHNNKKKYLEQKWQGHKKERTASSFPPFGKDSYSCAINHLSFRLYSYLYCCLRLFCGGFTVVQRSLSFVKVHRSLQCDAEMSCAVFKTGCKSLFEVVVHATQQILGNL